MRVTSIQSLLTAGKKIQKITEDEDIILKKSPCESNFSGKSQIQGQLNSGKILYKILLRLIRFQ